MVTNGEITKGISTLYDTINQIIEEARAAVYRTANITMVRACLLYTSDAADDLLTV